MRPTTCTSAPRSCAILRYGENPHQAAALYADRNWGFGAARVLQGKALSFTNLLDLDAAARLALEFDAPAAAVIKHTNPCGVATAGSLRDAYVTAREVDPLSAFGGIVGLNRRLDGATAAAIAESFIEGVVAPAIDDEARAVLAKKKNLRLVVADFSGGDDAARRDVRSIMGPGWCRSGTASSNAPSRGAPAWRWCPASRSGSSRSGRPPPRSGRRSGSPGASARMSSRTR